MSVSPESDESDESDGVVLRPARTGDEAGISAVFADAFAVDQPSWPPAPEPPYEGGDGPEVLEPQLWVAEVDGEVVATTFVRRRGQWFGGRRLPAAGIGGVAVRTGVRGGGLGGRLVRRVLDEASAEGAVLAALVPSSHRFYERLGFGVAGRHETVTRPASLLRHALSGRGAGRVRPAAPDDAAAVADLVEARGREVPGLLDRRGPVGGPDGPATDPSGPGCWVVVRDGAVSGWVQVDRSPSSRPGTPYDVVVADLVGDTVDDERQLWGDVVLAHPGDLLVTSRVDPAGWLERDLPRTAVASTTQTWMLGLLDPAAALTGRGWPAGVSADLVLHLTGPGEPAVLRLRVDAGVAEVTSPASDPASAARAGVLRLDRPTLASVYAAHLDPWAARRLGLAEADDETLAVAAAVFAAPPATLARPF